MNIKVDRLIGGGAGDPCGCACASAYSGGSPTMANLVINSQGGLVSYGGYCADWISYGALFHFEPGGVTIDYAEWIAHCDGGCYSPPYH
jgi:hypothetical protein